MTWLGKLHRAMAILSLRPVLNPNPLTWRPMDAENLRGFLTSPTGIRLGARMRDAIAVDALSAVHAPTDRLAWKAGHAAGMQNAVAILDALAALPEESTGPNDDRPSDSLDWLTPPTHG